MELQEMEEKLKNGDVLLEVKKKKKKKKRRKKKRKRENRKEKIKEEEEEVELLQDPLEVLGRDRMLMILKNLDARSVALSLLVSRAWHDVAPSDSIWSAKIYVLLEIDPTASNIVDKDRKMTSLHLATGRGNAIKVKEILSVNPECYELVDNRGWNFLHYAMVSFLVKNKKIFLKIISLAMSLINEGDAKENSILLGRLELTITLSIGKMLVLDTFCNMAILRSKEEIQKLLKDVGRGQYLGGAVFIRTVLYR